MSALKVAHELDIRVPAQLSVIGFANMKAADYASPALTTIEQPFDEIGAQGVRMLLDMIEEREHGAETNGTAEAQEVAANYKGGGNIKLLPTKLIERESAGPVPSP